MRERRRWPGRCAAIALAAGASGLFARAGAQEYVFRPRTQWEVRADGLSGSPGGVQLGAGADVPVGYYLRVGALLAGGSTLGGASRGPDARVDLTARYLLDPFRETRWGAYAGIGLTSRWDDDTHWQSWLLLVAGIEGPGKAGWTSSLEAGFGGGVRFGIVFRRARENGR